MGFISNQAERPVTKYIDWSGDVGGFKYYDKENKKNVFLPKKFQFIPIEERSTVKGFYERTNSGIYANEVYSLKDQPLSVKSFKGGEIATGLWRDIADTVNSAGGKFCNSVYGLLLSKDGNELVNFQFYGSAIGSWIDSGIKSKDQVIVTVSTNPTKQKKGKTEYYVPTFEKKPVGDNEQLREECVEAYAKVSEYLSQYDTLQKEDTPNPSTDDGGSRFDSVPLPTDNDELSLVDEEDDLPF